MGHGEREGEKKGQVDNSQLICTEVNEYVPRKLIVAYTLASECFNTGTSLYFPATFFTMKWLNAGKHNHTHVHFSSKTLQFCVERRKGQESQILPERTVLLMGHSPGYYGM